MRKLLKFIFLTLIAALLAAGYHLYAKQKKNIVSEVPYPYYFIKDKEENSAPTEKAPILIIGDRMGQRLNLFKDLLSKKLSQGLSKPLKINSITMDGLSLPRVINKLKNYGQLPLIVIYAGMSQEFSEKRFNIKDIKIIDKNFNFYDDLRIQTALTVMPKLSKFLYHPVNYVVYNPESISVDKTEYSDEEVLKKKIFTYRLFEREIKELFTYITENNSFIISLTAPINLEIAPKKVCAPPLDDFAKNNYDKMIELIKLRDYKQAYVIGKELTLLAANDAKIHFIQGQISKRLGKHREARNSFIMAASLDCKSWRASPIFNEILRKAANDSGTLLFDFHKLVYSSWEENVLFESEIYPQNLYYQKLVNMLSIKIKRILKL